VVIAVAFGRRVNGQSCGREHSERACGVVARWLSAIVNVGVMRPRFVGFLWLGVCAAHFLT
jgi:hypothetical protein